MKKIGVFLGAVPGQGGMFQYSLSLLEALVSLHGVSNKVVAAFFDGAWKPYVEAVGAKALALHADGGEPFTLGRLWRTACLPIAPWRKGLWRLDPVARAMVAEQCDTWFFPAQDHWAYLAPVSAVATIHDLMHRYEPQFPEVSRWGRYFLREYRFSNVCRAAKAVLVDSELGRTHVIDSYGLDQKRLFALPYLPPRYIFEEAVPKDFDRRYRLPSRFLFYPAQFWRHKNHDRLLQALAIVRRSCPDIALVLAGPKRHEYEKLAKRIEELGLQGRVIFPGYIPDVDLPEFYRRARALIMPTFFGPTNIPPLEAFVCGCPVAVSNIYGMPEQLGNAAVFFDPRSVEEIATAIKSLWLDDELCRQLSEKGRRRISKWGQKEFTERLRSIISEIDSL